MTGSWMHGLVRFSMKDEAGAYGTGADGWFNWPFLVLLMKQVHMVPSTTRKTYNKQRILDAWVKWPFLALTMRQV